MKVLSHYHKDVIVIELLHIVLAVFDSVGEFVFWRHFEVYFLVVLLMAASREKIIVISGAFTEVPQCKKSFYWELNYHDSTW